MNERKCECGCDLFIAIYPSCAYIRCVDDTCTEKTVCVHQSFYDIFIEKYFGSENPDPEITELKKKLEQLEVEETEVRRKLTSSLHNIASLERTLHEARVEKHVLCKKITDLECVIKNDKGGVIAGYLYSKGLTKEEVESFIIDFSESLPDIWMPLAFQQGAQESLDLIFDGMFPHGIRELWASRLEHVPIEDPHP